jgi:hypothetical protein
MKSTVRYESLFGRCVIQWGPLSYFLALDYCDFRKMPCNLVDVVSNVTCHADVWISFVRLRISSDRPTRVS